MTHRIAVHAIVLVMLAALTGCAGLSYTPHSELVMFQQERIPSTGERRTDRYVHGLASLNHTAISGADIEADFPGYENIFLTSVTTHAVFMSPVNSAISIGAGSALGLDVTLPVFPERFSGLYFTQGFSTGAIQSILQQKLLQQRMFGLSAGLHYQYSRTPVIYDRSNETCSGRGLPLFASCYDWFDSHAIGLRSVMVYSFQPSASVENLQSFYVTAAARYDFGLKAVYPALSVSLVIR